MRKRVVISLLFLGLFLPGLVSAAAPSNQTDFYPKTDVDVWVDGWGWHHWWYTGLDSSDTIYVNVEVTSGGSIDFFICDQENWDIWESGSTASVYSNLANRGSISVTFNIPYSGTWHVVFSNDALLTQKHIEGYIGTSPQLLPLGDLTWVVMLFVAIVVVGVIWEGLKRTQKSSMVQHPQSMPPQQPYTTQTRPPTGAPTNFCPYCGTQKQSSTASFCATCGRAFEGPSLG